MLNSKKAQLTWIILLVLALAIIIFAPFSFGLSAYFLSKNLFVLLGVFLIVVGAVGFFMKLNTQIALVFFAVGLVLVFVPTIFKNLAGVTLGVIIP